MPGVNANTPDDDPMKYVPANPQPQAAPSGSIAGSPGSGGSMHEMKSEHIAPAKKSDGKNFEYE